MSHFDDFDVNSDSLFDRDMNIDPSHESNFKDPGDQDIPKDGIDNSESPYSTFNNFFDESSFKPESSGKSKKGMFVLLLIIMAIPVVIMLTLLFSEEDYNNSFSYQTASDTEIFESNDAAYPQTTPADPEKPVIDIERDMPASLAGIIKNNCCWVSLQGNENRGSGGVFIDNGGTLITLYLPEFRDADTNTRSFCSSIRNDYKCRFKKQLTAESNLIIMKTYAQGFRGMKYAEVDASSRRHYIAAIYQNKIKFTEPDAFEMNWRKYASNSAADRNWWPVFDDQARLAGAYRIINDSGVLQPRFFEFTEGSLGL